MRIKDIVKEEVPAKAVPDKLEPDEYIDRLDQAASGGSIDVTDMPSEQVLQILKQLDAKNLLGITRNGL
jgi:hypothetical protein